MRVLFFVVYAAFVRIKLMMINVFFVKYDVLVLVPLHVCVMYRNISAWLIVNCSRLYKARPTACLTYFHLRRTSVVCVLQDMITFLSVCQYSFCKNSFIPRCVFHFFVIESLTSVYDSLLMLFFFFLSFSFVFFQHLRLSFVIFLLIKRYHN